MSTPAQVRVLLSGGIGSGKSTVGRMLAATVTVIDADEVGHRVLDHDGTAFALVADRWPDVVRDGVIDRASLAQVVFGDAAQLHELESITHPAIRAEIASRLVMDPSPVVVVEVPLLSDLLGPGWRRVVVDAPDDVRRERLLSRGMTAADIAQRMAAQPSRQIWLEAADIVVDNSGSLGDLEDEVGRLLGVIADGARAT